MSLKCLLKAHVSDLNCIVIHRNAQKCGAHLSNSLRFKQRFFRLLNSPCSCCGVMTNTGRSLDVEGKGLMSRGVKAPVIRRN